MSQHKIIRTTVHHPDTEIVEKETHNGLTLTSSRCYTDCRTLNQAFRLAKKLHAPGIEQVYRNRSGKISARIWERTMKDGTAQTPA